jgi:hypothetical protein
MCVALDKLKYRNMIEPATPRAVTRPAGPELYARTAYSKGFAAMRIEKGIT